MFVFKMHWEISLNIVVYVMQNILVTGIYLGSSEIDVLYRMSEKPVVCSQPLCMFRYEELGVGVKVRRYSVIVI